MVVHSTCVYTILFFSTSNCVIIFVAFSWMGSICVCLSCLCAYAVFSSACNLFISCVPFKRSMMLIVFLLCLRSCIYALILSSSWSHYWTCSSSSNVVQSCVVLSNNFVIVLDCFSNSASWSAAYAFLYSLTSGGVVEVNFSFNSSICCL
jgi:hypothetical protein